MSINLSNIFKVAGAVFEAVMMVEAGQPGSIDISVHGKAYTLTVAPKGTTP